jgi:hypothetical protein
MPRASFGECFDAMQEHADFDEVQPVELRIIVTGGRDFADPAFLWRTLDQIDRERGRISCVIEGASDDVTGPYVGADYWAHQWALARNRPTARCHADWQVQGRAAGPIRNRRMCDMLKPDLVVSYPGGKGTRNMTDLAREAGIEVLELRPPS